MAIFHAKSVFILIKEHISMKRLNNTPGNRLKQLSILFFIIPAFILTSCNVINQQDSFKEVEAIDQNEILKIAEKYYNETKVRIENDLNGEFDRIVDWTPSFDGENQDIELSSSLSSDVALLVTYYDAKNFYLAFASAVFEKDIYSVTSATNLGTAISSYCDRLNMEGDDSRKNEMYNDAIFVYLYSIKLSATEGKYTESSIIPLVCLGNLYLDFGKDKKAFDCYDNVLKIDRNNKKALMGMESYYRATNMNAKMLEMQKKQAETPTVIGEAANKIEKDAEWLQEGVDLEGDALEAFTVKMSELPPISLADFYEKIDPDTAKKVRDNVKLAQSKMDFAVPSANILLQFSHYSHTVEPSFIAALEVFTNINAEYIQSEDWNDNINEAVDNSTEILDGLGIDLEIDGVDLSEYTEKKLEDPNGNDDREPNVDISGLDNAGKIAENMLKAAQSKDNKTYWEGMAKMDTSYKIMTINPFEYANSYDIMVQQNNITTLKSKLAIYKKNIAQIQMAMMQAVSEASMKMAEKYYPLLAKYGEKEYAINEKYSGDELIVKIHALHKESYPVLNNVVEPLWGQTTEVAAVNYRKLEKHLPIMYKDCMSYIMLISDDKIREKEESDLKRFLEETVFGALNYIGVAYAMPTKLDIYKCGCDTDLVNALKEKFEKEREKAANEHLKKVKKDRNDFLSGRLDENSQLYQKIIKKYEYTTDLGFYKYTHNEYKSTTSLNTWTPVAKVDFDKMQNHFTGKTYVNADLEISGKVNIVAAEADVSAKFGYSFVQGRDGSIHPDDIDIRSGLSAGMSVAKVFNISGGTEASAIRGLTGNASISLTGNGYIDDFKKENMPGDTGDWVKTPDFTKKVWEGKY